MGEVVKLPTAAPRKVKNSRWKEQRSAAGELRSSHPWPLDVTMPYQREALARAQAINSIEKTPALVTIQALLTLLPENTRKALIDTINADAHKDDAHMQALEIAKSTMPRSKGETYDLIQAFKYLADQG